jgi:glycosyltransferase involved in cell wall biosynthesis
MTENRIAASVLPLKRAPEDGPLRVALGLLFHPRSPFAVSGYTAYTTRVIRVFEASSAVKVHPWTEPGPHVLGRASSVGPVRAAHRVLERQLARRERPPIAAGRAPESLLPGARYSPPNERRIEAFCARMKRERVDVFHITDWSTVGTLLFEACRRAEVPYVVSAVDYKPICAQNQLLENDQDICEGPTSNERCVACSRARGWQTTTDEMAGRQEALGRHLADAARIVAFTGTHVRELDRWLGFGRDRYSIVPFAVPAPRPGFAKDPDAFEHPLRFAFLARASHEWGLEVLLEAWRVVGASPSSAVLEIYTDWRFEAQGMALRFAADIERGSVRVHVGSVFDRIDDIHRGTAAVVVPSRWKNTGSAGALEALERATPVITENRHGVFDDLPKGMRGLAYESGELQSLAAVLEATISHPERLARASRDSPFHRPFDDHVAALGGLYREAFHGRRPA